MIRILNSQGKNKNGGGIAAAVLQCMIQCILSCLEELIKFLNHNAIIAMAMTGEDYIDSVKSAISMIL